ncbi:unnamed protein product [Durusdinium trenchii]|uniref:Ribosome biogenesis protein NOP53 n=1 Tax=Durusdinium trenchii TaxID=1381693 RepID=A0ABP0IXK8_9DINO
MVKNRKRKAAEPSEAKDKVSTAELEAIVFGGASFQGEEKSEQAKEAKEAKEDVEEAPETGARRAAWVDPDDADLEVPLVGRRGRLRHKATHVTGEEYEQLLRQQFTKLNGVARWTEKQPTKELSDSEEEEEEFEAIASSMPAVARGGFHSNGLISNDSQSYHCWQMVRGKVLRPSRPCSSTPTLNCSSPAAAIKRCDSLRSMAMRIRRWRRTSSNSFQFSVRPLRPPVIRSSCQVPLVRCGAWM